LPWLAQAGHENEERDDVSALRYTKMVMYGWVLVEANKREGRKSGEDDSGEYST